MSRKTCKYCNISFYRPSAGSDIPNDSCTRCHGNLKAEANESDPVNSPAHYQGEGGIECIDAIRAALTPEEFRGYCKGNVFKYLWRHERKNGAEDVRKARWYLERLTKELEKLHEPIIRESDEWVPNNGKKPDLPDGTLIDIRFADGYVSPRRSADSWTWTQDGEIDDITHYRIRQPE